MMIDPERVAASESKGLTFVCRMCVKWYQGEDRGLKDVEGDTVCAAQKECSCPITGGGFEEYEGPLKGNLHKYCYVCGKENPEKALEAQVLNARKIGCCNMCFENVVKRVASRPTGRRILFTSERRAGPDKFDLIKG